MGARSRPRPTRATPITEIEAARGRGVLLYVDLDDQMTVGVELRNLESLLALGLIPDPLTNAAMRFGKRAEATPESTDGVMEGIELQDVICANAIKEPPYADLAEVRSNGGRSVPGKLDLSLMTSNQIRSLLMLVMHGLEAWESFRDEQRRALAGLRGEDVGDDAERVAEDPPVESPAVEAAYGPPVDYAGQGIGAEAPGSGEPVPFRIGERRAAAGS